MTSLKRLKPKGHYITTMPSWGLLWGLVASLFSKKTIHSVEVQPRQADLEQVANLIAAGQLQIPIECTFKVKDMEQAVKRQRQRKTG
jgi:NADPH:quinone reductase-like Zn-dependent oxidoreductase